MDFPLMLAAVIKRYDNYEIWQVGTGVQTRLKL